jgi:hypothetical protein
MIDNKKIPTSLGVAIIIIFAITAGMFVWQIVKKQEVTKQPQSIAIQANSDEKKQGQVELRDNNPTVTNAEIIKGWQKYISHNNSFSIEFPDNWKVNNTVFTDKENRKIAEFLPGIIAPQSNRQCFDDIKDDARTKSISKENISINKYPGVSMILKVNREPGGGTWTSNLYCVKKEDTAFIMAFYSPNLTSDEKKLFNKIISTLELK